MEKIKTSELFDMYFATLNPDVTKKTRGQVDRKEVYEYEKKIGKQLIEMDVDELFEMILTFNGNRNYSNANYSVGYSSFQMIASIYRNIFNYYIDNIKVIKNPFNDKRMKGMEAAKRLSKDKEPFTKELVNDTIKKIHQDNDEARANYIECIMLLYYCGFATAHEIIEMKEDMIDFQNKTVRIIGRTIVLSDRCFELLLFNHNSKILESERVDFVMTSWHDSYFKFPVRARNVESLQERSTREMANIINREISTRIKARYGIDIGYRSLYFLGFYEYIKKICGKERAAELITAVRDTNATKALMNLARMYGVVADNVTILKKALRPYLELEAE